VEGGGRGRNTFGFSISTTSKTGPEGHMVLSANEGSRSRETRCPRCRFRRREVVTWEW